MMVINRKVKSATVKIFVALFVNSMDSVVNWLLYKLFKAAFNSPADDGFDERNMSRAELSLL
jgi:hypothetical protein